MTKRDKIEVVHLVIVLAWIVFMAWLLKII